MQSAPLTAHPIHWQRHEPLVGYEGSAQQRTLAASIPSDAGEQAALLFGVFTAQLHVPLELRHSRVFEEPSEELLLSPFEASFPEMLPSACAVPLSSPPS